MESKEPNTAIAEAIRQVRNDGQTVKRQIG